MDLIANKLFLLAGKLSAFQQESRNPTEVTRQPVESQKRASLP
jgi:hypothetical protein